MNFLKRMLHNKFYQKNRLNQKISIKILIVQMMVILRKKTSLFTNGKVINNQEDNMKEPSFLQIKLKKRGNIDYFIILLILNYLFFFDSNEQNSIC